VKAPLSWLREFVDAPADPVAVARRLADCGFAVESVEGDVIDFEITANRPDCLSVYGLARETAAAFNLPLRPLAAGDGEPARPDRARSNPAVRVTIDDPGCRRYALGVAAVRVGPSPAWLAERLQAAGVRPINNIVDVTNYVLLEMGHPMHAFDLAKLGGPEIRVRLARPGERLTTLDGQTRTLDESMLAIADAERAVAIAGVMGGASSEVSASTARIALESAWFEPAPVRAASRRLGLKTEASARFERGADIEAPVRAIRRALALFQSLGAGEQVEPTVDVYPVAQSTRSLVLRRARLDRLLGTAVPAPEVLRILTALGFEPAGQSDGWTVRVPSFRVDVQREADLIEEIGRHWGFDRIPPTLPALRTPPPPHAPSVGRGRVIRNLLTGAGLQEAETFTFIERAAAEPFAGPDGVVPIANPLSEKFAVMRPSLLPGLLDALVYNRHREAAGVRLFEVGSAFTPGGEVRRVGWMLTGPRLEHWSGSEGDVDVYDAKGIAELVGRALGHELEAEPADDLPWFVRGRSARLFASDAGGRVELARVGQLLPNLAAARGLDSGVVVAGELDLRTDGMRPAAGESDRRVRPLPRHPSIVRDLSIVVDERLPAAKVRGTIRRNAPATLVDVREFDRYQGAGVPQGSVSLSLRLTFRHPERTLTDSEVQQAVEAIVSALTAEHGVRLR
jgi:phenylalanyl-tRNA synthetase beta chain